MCSELFVYKSNSEIIVYKQDRTWSNMGASQSSNDEQLFSAHWFNRNIANSRGSDKAAIEEMSQMIRMWAATRDILMHNTLNWFAHDMKLPKRIIGPTTWTMHTKGAYTFYIFGVNDLQGIPHTVSETNGGLNVDPSNVYIHDFMMSVLEQSPVFVDLFIERTDNANPLLKLKLVDEITCMAPRCLNEENNHIAHFPNARMNFLIDNALDPIDPTRLLVLIRMLYQKINDGADDAMLYEISKNWLTSNSNKKNAACSAAMRITSIKTSEDFIEYMSQFGYDKWRQSDLVYLNPIFGQIHARFIVPLSDDVASLFSTRTACTIEIEVFASFIVDHVMHFMGLDFVFTCVHNLASVMTTFEPLPNPDMDVFYAVPMRAYNVIMYVSNANALIYRYLLELDEFRQHDIAQSSQFSVIPNQAHRLFDVISYDTVMFGPPVGQYWKRQRVL